jgi:GNAT superfamily N-acetyltransferase
LLVGGTLYVDELSLITERIERADLADLHAAASPTVKASLGLELKKIGGALVSIARNEPSILLNRAIGLGVERPATQTAVAEITAAYAAAGVARYFVHLHPEAEPADLKHWLLEAGLVKYRGWMKFRRNPVAPPVPKTELEIRLVGAEHGIDFGTIAAPCFDLSDKVIPLLACLVDRADWHVYMSFANGKPAGTGALLIREGVAWLNWGATHRDYRGKGRQSAVLAARIRHAIDAGCRILLTATGEAVEGDPQHSYKNIMRAGFEPAYLRENYVPAG